MFSPRVQWFKDLFWSQHGRWPVCPSDTRHVSHTFQTSSGNCLLVVLVFLVMYTTDAVLFECCLLVGIEMEFGTFQGRQFLLVKGQAMKRCSRNYGDLFLSGCLLMLISKQCFGLYWQSFCTSFIWILITNIVLTCVFLSFLHSYSLLQCNSSSSNLHLF